MPLVPRCGASVSNIIPFPTMSTQGAHAKENELQAALALSPELTIHGYRAERGETNGVAITRNDHLLGIWHFADGYYLYTPASCRRPTMKSRDLSPAEQGRPSHRECRRYERWIVHWSAVLRTTSEEQVVIIENVSAGGLGVRGLDGLAVADPLVVELHSCYRLAGTVARVWATKYGIRYRYPLGPADPLVIAARSGIQIVPGS